MYLLQGLDSWAARYNTWLLTKLTPKGVVFSILSFCFYLLWLQLEYQFITGQAAQGQFQVPSKVV